MAGALTGGFLQIRSGLKPAFRSAVFGGVLLVRGWRNIKALPLSTLVVPFLPLFA
jgi:hypothetical protein